MPPAREVRARAGARLRTWSLVAATSVLVALPLAMAGLAGGAGTLLGDAPSPIPIASAAVYVTHAAAAPAVPVPPDPVPAPSPMDVDTAPEEPSALTLPGSRPTHVRIAAIGVDSELVDLGLQDDGRMEVPPGAFPAGWYTGAPTPGELGPAVLAGHVDYGGEAGVFQRLGDLVAGDTVEVAREDGTTAVFRVLRVEQHRKDAFPTAAVYGDIDHAGLRLITCGGPFDRQVGSYEDNIVVYAELVAASDPSDA